MTAFTNGARAVRAVESVHAEYVAWRAEALGGSSQRLSGGGVITRCDRHPDHWYANRMLAATAGDAVEVGSLRRGGRPLRVEVPEPLLDDGIRRALGDAGLEPGWTARVLASPLVVPAAAPVAGVELERVTGPRGAERFWAAYEACFEEPQPERTAHVAMLAERPGGVTAHVACAGDDVVGVAIWFRSGPVALLADAATRPGWRGRGIHALLVAARLQDAQRAGAHLVTSDVEPGGGSDRNLSRLGLRGGYEREVWVPAQR